MDVDIDRCRYRYSKKRCATISKLTVVKAGIVCDVMQVELVASATQQTATVDCSRDKKNSSGFAQSVHFTSSKCPVNEKSRLLEYPKHAITLLSRSL